MPYDFIREAAYLKTAFPPSGARQHPAQIDDMVSLVADYFSSGRLQEVQGISGTAAGATTIVNLSTNTDKDHIWFVLACAIHHTQALARRIGIVQVINYTGTEFETALVEFTSKNNSENLVLPRPIVLPPRSILRGKTHPSDTIAAGSNFVINAQVVEVPLGEYVRLT
jgi:hypothetical protein